MRERIIIITLIFILSFFVSSKTIYASEIAEYEFPIIEPLFFVQGGYRFVDIDKAQNSAEYEYPHNSIVLGGESRIFLYPYRLHLELDFINKKDYFGELKYSYKDILFFRGINRTIFHNLENIRISSGIKTSSPAPFQPSYFNKDSPDERYGVRAAMNSLLLRFKTPDFPAHLIIEGNLIEKDGQQQQRSLLGSGWFNSPVRTSQERDIN